jgi:hypothetical protein
MRRFLFTLVTVCLVLPVQATFGQIETTLKLVPNSANAIAIYKVEQIYGSELASREKWIENSRLKYSKSPLFFPASTKSVVLAAEIDVLHGSTTWEAAYMTMKSSVQMDVVAKLMSGTKDELGGYETVETAGGSLILKLNNNTLATAFPANRQQIGRWARASKSNGTGQLSPFLKRIAERAQKSDAEIVMGLDLVDVVRPNRLRDRLAKAKEVKDSGVNMEALVRTIKSIQGVTLEIRLKTNAQGIMRIEFANDADSLSKVGKPLVQEVLKESGVYLDDMDKWVANVEGKELILRGRLSTNGLRRVSSLIEPPPIQISALDTGDSGADVERVKALATQEHWDSVQTMLRDLRNFSPQTRNQLAFYYERYARKMDALPQFNVDSECLDYSANIADILRKVALLRRGVVASTSATRKQFAGVNYTRGGYGWVGGRSGQTASEAASAGVVARGAVDKATLMNDIDKITAETRRTLTKKFVNLQITFK